MPDAPTIDLNAAFHELIEELESEVVSAREQSTNHEHNEDLREYFKRRADKRSTLLERLRAAHERGLLL